METEAPIEDQRELLAYLASGCKPREAWRIGTEHEKFAYQRADGAPLPYDGPVGIEALLRGIAEHGWEAVVEDGHVVALGKDACSITLEPGGQVELSGAPLESIHETCDEVNGHLALVKAVAEPLGARFMGMGFHPKWPREAFPWMPKARYRIMRDYMPKVGDMGLDMMLRTCTVQVNLDFDSERDMVEKFRIGLALQPLATALFANSPFAEGRPTGFLSYRSHAWTRTDPDRSGMLPFVFEASMGFERWLDHVLDVPMYFVRRDGRYRDAAGQSFRAFLAGRLPALPGERPTLSDFKDHLTTVFTEVRLKTFLEMRGADGGPWRRLCALPAFWVGLLYDADAQAAALDLIADLDVGTLARLREEVPRLGLRAPVAGRDLRALGLEVLEIARRGLARRARLNAAGDDESGFLNALFDICDAGVTPAERKLALYEGRWGRSVDPIFEECAY